MNLPGPRFPHLSHGGDDHRVVVETERVTTRQCLELSPERGITQGSVTEKRETGAKVSSEEDDA